MKLQGKRVVVIGGTSGIRSATAKAAVSAGAKVVIAGRSEQKIQQAQAVGSDVENCLSGYSGV